MTRATPTVVEAPEPIRAGMAAPRRLVGTGPSAGSSGPYDPRSSTARRVPAAAPRREAVPRQRHDLADSDTATAAPPAGTDAGDSSNIKTTGWFAYVVRRHADGRLGLAVAWPLWALLVPFPLWWAMGLGSFMFILLAIPMAVTLVRRRGSLRFPRGWILWALFLLWALLSLLMYAKNPATTHAGSLVGRMVSTVVLLSNYAGATVTMLFVGNLNANELPVLRAARWLGALFLTTVAGGFLGTFLSHLAFTSPVELLVRLLTQGLFNRGIASSLRADPYISALIHPAAAQLQSVLGTEGGRAAAPFAYTNFWANSLSLLLIWFICAWGINTSPLRKVVCGVCVALATIPVIYSLNRGLWLGIAISVLWVAVRLFLHGRVAALLSVLIAVSLGGLIFLVSPLHSTLNARLDHPQSNSIRSYLMYQSIHGAEQSPLIGWGGTRKTDGSAQSITVGKSPDCRQCGDFTIGSTGQLWSVLFYQGFVGAGLFFGFFAAAVWTYRRDRSPVGQSGVLVVALTFVYMLFYVSVPAPLTITMISVGLLWRSDDESGVRLAVRRLARPRAPVMPAAPA